MPWTRPTGAVIPRDDRASLRRPEMSARNGDKARFQKDRKRKLAKRQRIQALVARARADESTAKAPAKS
jgi:hypothetical protein